MQPEIRRILDEKGVVPGREVVVYGAAAVTTRRPSRPALADARHRERPRLRRRLRDVGGGSGPAARAPAEVRPARPHRLAPPGARRRAPRGRARRQVPALPRELRRARGIRRGPHPGRALPRHELARGSGRLEPPLARGDRRRAARARHHPRHHRGRSTAATPRATPTRSGRAVAPARSRRHGR